MPIESSFGDITPVEQVCVMGSGRAQPLALVVLNVSISDEEKPAFNEKLSAQVGRINGELEAHCRLNNVLVVKEPWTIENGLLTPTMKIKRDQIEAKYADMIGDDLAKQGLVVWE